MPRRSKGLTALEVAKAVPGPSGKPRRLSDGGGLYLLVRTAEAKYWLFRYQSGGRERTIGLGPAAGRIGVTLTSARERARRLLDQIRDGKDPRAERDAARQARRVAAARSKTFREAAELCMDVGHRAIRNEKDRKGRRTAMSRHVYPHFGDLPLSAIDTSRILEALRPIWDAHPVLAVRLRGQIERTFDYGKIRGWCAGDNPAKWRGHLEHALADPAKVKPPKHHEALAWKDVPAFMANLRRRNDIPAR